MLENLKLVFKIYGGVRALTRSSYLWISFVLAISAWGIWTKENWPERVLSTLPNFIGFSIAAIAIITVIGDDGFRKRMAEISEINPAGDESDLVVITASFIWFIFIQVVSLIYSYIYSAKPFPHFCYCCLCESNHDIYDTYKKYANLSFSFIGVWIFLYSILLMIAAIFQLFSLFRLYIRNLK